MSIFLSLAYFTSLIFVLISIDLIDKRSQNQIDTLRSHIVDIRLEQLKDEITFPQLVRIVESLQAAVEKIPIREAFDELDNERDYYQAKRAESNERLIKRKGMIGKIVGFAPMVGLFVGYLIVPLVAIGLTSMTSSFSSVQGM